MSATTSTPPRADLALGCPGCGAALTGTPTCSTCRLPLTGPVAARLWQVDVELARLARARADLLGERVRLLAVLRRGAPEPIGVQALTQPARAEWTPRRVQNLLLVTGGVLLAVAAVVFAAVTYERLGATGRAAVLLGLTGAAAAVAPRLRRSGLTATAETVAGLTLALGLLDAWGLRRLGLGAGLDDRTWLAAVSLVLALLCGGYASAVRLRVPRLASVVLASAAALLVVARLELRPTASAVLLAAVAALGLAGVAVLRTRERSAATRELTAAAVVAAAAVAALALTTALGAVVVDGEVAAVALLACAALSALAAAVAWPGVLRSLLSALPVPLAAAAVLVGTADRLSPAARPVLAGLVGLVVLAALPVARREHRPGPAAGALAVTVAAVLAVTSPVLQAVVGPLGWLADPWSLPAGTGARAALGPALDWDGTWHVLAVLALAAAACAGAGQLLGAATAGRAAGAALAVLGLVLVPLAADLPHPAALLVLVALATAAVGAADAVGRADGVLRPGRALALLGAAAGAGTIATAWSLADRGTTLAVLPAVAVLAAVVATRPALPAAAPAATVGAAVLLGAELAAAGAAAGLAVEQVGGLLLLAPAALLALPLATPRLDAARRHALEAAAALLASAAVVLAADDPGWLSWSLAGAGLLVLAIALRREHRRLAPAGVLLVTASSWVRLLDADVHQPEPYVLPVAVLLLVLGHLRFRRDPAVRSQSAYGPGLALLLVPTALAALGEDGLARPLLVGAAALVAVLVGARTRLQAPLVDGSAVLLVVAVDLLAPYAAAVPRWSALATAGTLLVLVGATFEQRRRDVADLRERVAGLR